ncbi:MULTISPECIES: fimbria/pilus outer membrane usher protein [Providencia]|uniref:Fimbrial biogenesis outer membrane usher protein n=1 Tax=Providencia stuartii TaxID=588 RepID=A0AAI9I073_PROST|nr:MULTISPECIES: fimbria/pilus outer membrane usher protein [Providencia]ELR5045981.1 fimbrial biogenesis outer membrane usher protein [Providencia rettgeri]ELR5035834.1 fimbrial biogenesis outer membrane usher protein [Providencia stuartii]ELR5290255.1 fimbrial biogenesis outer membrane usher protein [Providencia stuartii]MCR4178646.1 fimbrial biogenesis outer membrane usher protein [Providencia vermicola]URE79886.1 fimbrial biogenesis outer membrane usher protein [Providencia stuartii]
MNRNKHISPVCVSPTKFVWHPIALCLMLSIHSAVAEDYFDPAFLQAMGETDQVDLSAYAKKGSIAPGEYLVSVYINQVGIGQLPVTFKENNQGVVSPVLTPAFLEKYGVNIKQLPKTKDLPENYSIDNLSALIPDASTHFNIAILELEISIPQVAMKASHNESLDPDLLDYGVPALMANYSFSYGHTENKSKLSSNRKSDNFFATVRAGLNAGAWRLRSTITHSQQNTDGQAQKKEHQRYTRFTNTYLYRELFALRSVLLVGENNTGGDVFDSVPFRGLKLSSSEEMLPSQLRGYAPPIEGIANSNARVTVRQNGNVIYETYVAPGAFYINDIQEAGLSGDYDVTITEANGTERKFIVPYSSLPVMLRPGGWKYEITAGRYDGNVTNSSREAEFLLGTAVYGLPNDTTVYGGVLAAEDYQAANIGAGISLGSIGAVSLDVTSSIAKLNGDSRKTGQSYRLRYSKSMMSTGTSIDLTALRYSTRNYYNFSEFNSEGYQLEEGVYPWAMQRRRSSFQTQVSQRMGDWGTLYVRATRDDYWGSSRTQTGGSIGYSNNYKGISYGANYSIDRIKDDNGSWPENRQISFNISIPFSIFGHSESLQSIYSTSYYTRDNNGRSQIQTGINGSLMSGDLTYSASQSWENKDGVNNSNINVGYQGSKGSVTAGYSHSSETQTFNMNANGGLLLHSGGLTLAKNMGESVALVYLPDAPDVSINNGSARSDWRGYGIAPYLSDYRRNSISIDPTTLPDDVDVAQTNINIYPSKGAVVPVNFTTKKGYQVLMTIIKNNSPVPFGAIASLQHTTDNYSSIVGDAGLVYLTGLPEKGKLLVKWGESAEKQCTVSFDLTNVTLDVDQPIRQVTYTCAPVK